jgi:outer membrane biosynthesis protein TonB
LEDHELIHLLDALDDETAKARFRESIYISVIICMAVAWFLLYGPRILFHQPEYKDFVSAMKERDKTVTFLDTSPRPAPRPTHTVPDRKTLDTLHREPRPTPQPPAPQQANTPPAPQQQPPAQEQARTTAPPVEKPALPLPSAPKAAPAPMVDAPSPSPKLAQNTPSAHDSMQDLMRGARGGAPGTYGTRPSAAGPLQAGAQILTDTQGVDFTAWLRRLHDDLQRNWDPLIPEEARSPLFKKGITGIRFTVLANGEIANPFFLETPSGDVALDHAAWSAITSEGQFPPLPHEFHGPKIELRVGFFYNEEVR